MDWGEAFRYFIAAIAAFCGGFQLVLRTQRSHYLTPAIGRKERAGARATAIVLGGIAAGNFVHSSHPITWITVVIAVGVIYAIYANVTLIRAMRLENAPPHHPS